ncbi:peptidylprolyl isomerase [Altererythrobacter aquiaggeris]|uniref:peptidylprolyl isomerase n=1 Tax=Aestuarierythrobacter aquiaggeris TaxID=1898396 RepID=UPI00301739C1
MKTHMMIAASLGLALAVPAAAQEADERPTPNSVIEAATPDQWATIPASDLLVMRLADDAEGNRREVVIQLMPAPFSQGWVDNIRLLANTHFWDGTSVYRVVDNWVTQWGDGEDDEALAKPLPEGIKVVPESEYVHQLGAVAALPDPCQNPSSGRPYTCDNYARYAGFLNGWPIAGDGSHQWPVHCYASVGVARDLTPNTGTGAELYAVIGQAPRQLDRNIAVVGRVIEGIEHLSALPRGKGGAGVYADDNKRTPIQWARLASGLAAEAQPQFEYLKTDTSRWRDYVNVRQNRSDGFYQMAAGGSDLCNIQVPVRRVKDSG